MLVRSPAGAEGSVSNLKSNKFIIFAKKESYDT
jgi:hypothetical protein